MYSLKNRALLRIFFIAIPAVALAPCTVHAAPRGTPTPSPRTTPHWPFAGRAAAATSPAPLPLPTPAGRATPTGAPPSTIKLPVTAGASSAATMDAGTTIIPPNPPSPAANLPAIDARSPWASPTDEAAVLRELRDTSLVGIHRRLGPDYASFHAGQKPEVFPEIYLAPTKKDAKGRAYQIGGPWTKNAGDFSSTQGQILYVPDAPESFPVDRVTISEWSNGVYVTKPEPPWHGGFRPEPASKKWIANAPNNQPAFPFATARGNYVSWGNCGLTIFSSGLVAAAGTVTARGGEPTVTLPPHKLPTAISITNKSEFALVTVCDTETHKGQVAVFSLQVNGKKGFVHEWQDAVWSLPSVGLLTDLKLLGYVDLPGIKFPTAVCAVGDREGGRMNGRDGNAGLLREYDLAKQPDRDVFFKGANASYSCTSGWAVVASKYENKVAFLDLQPLFQKVREMYFTTEENFQRTRNSSGTPEEWQKLDHWPQTFDANPSWKPPVVAVVDVPRPVAVLATLSGGTKAARAFVASLDGKIGMYSVGGLASADPANAKDIARLSEVQVGRNPVCLTYQKHSREKFLVCSRGDREISWVTYQPKGSKEPPKSMEVTKRMRDARLLDPVCIEVADTHGVNANIFTVTDFRGRQVLNYRSSTVTFATQGGAKFEMGADGLAEFECGGILEFPGSPFALSATNVN